MTSEAFDHIMLPGTTEFVTAGRFVLATDRAGIQFGRFVYGRSYLERNNAVPIDPIELPHADRTYAPVHYVTPRFPLACRKTNLPTAGIRCVASHMLGQSPVHVIITSPTVSSPQGLFSSSSVPPFAGVRRCM